MRHVDVEHEEVSDDELAALTAHWLLGRLSVLRAAIGQLATAGGLSEDERHHLLTRSRHVARQMQESLEAMARGLPPTLIDLSQRPADVTPWERRSG